MTEQLEVPSDNTGLTVASESTKEAVLEQPNSVKEAHHPSTESPVSSAIATEASHQESVPDKQPGPLALATVPDQVPVSSPSVSSNIVEGGSNDRDVALATLVKEKTHSHIRAWEDNKKAKSQNKFNKVVAKITAWENAKKAKVEAHMKTAAEKLEKKRAVLVEKMMNEIAEAHKWAEDQKAIAEAKKKKEFLEYEEEAAKHRASGTQPKKFLCFRA